MGWPVPFSRTGVIIPLPKSDPLFLTTPLQDKGEIALANEHNLPYAPLALMATELPQALLIADDVADSSPQVAVAAAADLVDSFRGNQVVDVVGVDAAHHEEALVREALEDGVGETKGHPQGVGNGALGDVSSRRRTWPGGGGRFRRGFSSVGVGLGLVHVGENFQLPFLHGTVRGVVYFGGICSVEHEFSGYGRSGAIGRTVPRGAPGNCRETCEGPMMSAGTRSTGKSLTAPKDVGSLLQYLAGGVQFVNTFSSVAVKYIAGE